MAFLSLGLHQDEPPTSPDQRKDNSPRDTEASSPANAPSALIPDSAGPRGNGTVPRRKQNGNSTVAFFTSPDDFEADRFEDEASASRSVPPDRKDVCSETSLPPSVEQLRRKLAEEENQRASRVEPAPLTASVVSLSSSEREWVPTFSTFKFGYFPGRGLLFSTVGHEIIIFGLFLLVTYVLPSLRPAKLIESNNVQDHTIYLPELGGGSEGEKSPGAGESAPQQPAAAPARASKGFAFPGKQAILSNPPNPTNTFQTIQRPLLVRPEVINKLVPAPNIVQMAETRLPNDLLTAKPVIPQLKEVPKPIRVKQDALMHRNAKFDVPVNAPKLQAKLEVPKLPAAEQPLPEAPKIQPQQKQEDDKREIEKPSPTPIKVATEKRSEKPQKESSPPSAAQVARLEMHGKAKEPILSLSPMPLPNGPDAKVPNGEARGKFAIAPGGTLNPNSITPGKASGMPSTTPGTGQENAKAPNAAGSDVASNAGAGTGGPGNGKGRGAAGEGAGAAGRQGTGSGAGGGSGSGTGSFPGITIQGSEDTQAKTTTKPSFTIEPQSSYGMTIVSTASSGGGLEDFGVFQNERIFTVYIPVKPSPELADPTWTMQYAVVKDGTIADTGSQQVVPPSIATSEWPQLPPALEKKYSHRQIVIYAVVGKDGKVSQVSVKRTPDPRVSDPIANVLKKWVFHPAQVNNQPASVKILLGIPLT